MKEYLFTELISIQFWNFMIMFLLGCCLFTMYRIIKMYILLRIKSQFIKSFFEIIFFVTASLFTGGVLDYCCGATFEPYMIPAIILGLPISYLIIGK